MPLKMNVSISAEGMTLDQMDAILLSVRQQLEPDSITITNIPPPNRPIGKDNSAEPGMVDFTAPTAASAPEPVAEKMPDPVEEMAQLAAELSPAPILPAKAEVDISVLRGETAKLLLAVSKRDQSGTRVAKELLASYGIARLGELAEDKLAEFKTKLEKL